MPQCECAKGHPCFLAGEFGAPTERMLSLGKGIDGEEDGISSASVITVIRNLDAC